MSMGDGSPRGRESAKPKGLARLQKAVGAVSGLKGWRAVTQSPRSCRTWTPLILELDVNELSQRARELDGTTMLRKVEARKNVSFDNRTGQANFLREVKFREKAWTRYHAEVPSGEIIPHEMHVVKALVADLVTIYKVYPGPVMIVRYRKTAQTSKENAEREAWSNELASNQVERMKQLMIEGGMPAADISTYIEVAGPGSPKHGFSIAFNLRTKADQVANREAMDNDRITVITRRGRVSFDRNLGRVTLNRDIPWKPKYCSSEKMDQPLAEVDKHEEFEGILKDMAEVWQIYPVSAAVVCDASETAIANGVDADWLRKLASNRGDFVKKAFEGHGLPRGMLSTRVGSIGPASPNEPIAESPRLTSRSLAGTQGLDPEMFQSHSPREDHSSQAKLAPPFSPSMQRSGSASGLKIQKDLMEAQSLHKVEDIPLLEDMLEEAIRLRDFEQKLHLVPLILNAESVLVKLQQRRRRLEAWQLNKNRSNALAHIRVAYTPRTREPSPRSPRY